METDVIPGGNRYGLEIETVDSLNFGNVVVHSTDYTGSNAPWGEPMYTVCGRKAFCDIFAIAIRSATR